MLTALQQSSAKRVFYYFEQLCQIPHGSGNTKAISDYCVAFAREHHLECYQDALNNVIIIRERQQRIRRSSGADHSGTSGYGV